PPRSRRVARGAPRGRSARASSALRCSRDCAHRWRLRARVPMTLVIALMVFVPMLVEALRSSRNERAQLARGGIEPSGDAYELMRIVYPASFLMMIFEGGWRGATPVPLLVGGAVVFATAKLLKWWAILTLGQAWTFRVIVVPGARLVTGGPYRFFRHPNYIGVVGEFAGVTLMTGALVTGPV